MERIEALAKEWKSDDDARAEDAERFRRELAERFARVTASDLSDVLGWPMHFAEAAIGHGPIFWAKAYYGEHHGLSILQEWLLCYDRLAHARAAEPPEISWIVLHAVELGRLEERLFWRATPDPETGAPPERLALARRKQRAGLASAARQNEANDARRAEAEEWRAAAREIAGASSLRGAGLEEHVRRELRRRGYAALPSGSAIRKALGPRRKR